MRACTLALLAVGVAASSRVADIELERRSQTVLTTASNRVEGALTVTNGCHSYTRIKVGDTCASLAARPSCGWAQADLVAANPGLKCDAATLASLVGKAVCIAGPPKSQLWPGAWMPSQGCIKYRVAGSALGDTCDAVAVQINDAAYNAGIFQQLNSKNGARVNCDDLVDGMWYCSCDGGRLENKPPTCKPSCDRRTGQCSCSPHGSSPSCQNHSCSSGGHLIGKTKSGYCTPQGQMCDNRGSRLTSIGGGKYRNEQGQSCSRNGSLWGKH